MRSRRGGWHTLLVLSVAAGALAWGCSPLASKGTMPPLGPNGRIDESTAPDFVAVADRGDGTAGYARRQDVLTPGNGPVTVYGDDLRTVVGHLVPDVGFVPLGTDPATLPTLEVSVAPSGDTGTGVSGQVVLYVRDDADTEVWIAVLVDGKEVTSTGFGGGDSGVGCYPMPRGSRLVIFDRRPDKAGASIVRQLLVRGAEVEPPSLWLTIGNDGAIVQGTGVPAWWGDPQTC